MTIIKDDKFVPFAGLEDSKKSSDFDLNAMVEMLELTSVQGALLGYLLRELDISIWLVNDEEGPTIELLAFYQRNLVSKTDLIKFLQCSFDERNQLDEADEINALMRLRKVVDDAINARETPPAK